MPKLSVLMPVRNGGAHLRTALRSTLRSMPKDSELVVVDDGSTDASATIIQTAAERDRRLRLVPTPGGLGVAGALNLGLEQSSSQFVARMDADDVALPWRFRRQLPQLVTADFVFGPVVIVTERGRPSGATSGRLLAPEAARLHLLMGNYLIHPTMMCTRQALESLGGYRRTLVEDYDLWLRACLGGFRLRQGGAPLLAYRTHGGQVTRTWTPPEHYPELDESFAALLPFELHDADVIRALRTSAIVRRRSTATEQSAWRLLSGYLHREVGRLPAAAQPGVLHRLREIDSQVGSATV